MVELPTAKKKASSNLWDYTYLFVGEKKS